MFLSPLVSLLVFKAQLNNYLLIALSDEMNELLINFLQILNVHFVYICFYYKRITALNNVCCLWVD